MAKFCSSCGAQLPEGTADCPACGKLEVFGAPESKPGGGVSTKVASAFCYLWVAAIIFLLVEPYNKNQEVRFHAYQGLFLAGIWFGGHVTLTFIPILGWMILPFWSLLMLAITVVCAVKAYQGTRLTLPVIGEAAAKQAMGGTSS